MADLTSNTKIEAAAIRFVLQFERDAGREARDTRGTGAAADVASTGRTIEVKAFGNSSRGQDLWLETRQVDAARADPAGFWLYIVENVRQGDPTKFRLICIGGLDLGDLLAKARQQRYYTVPWPVGVYDRLAAEDPVARD